MHCWWERKLIQSLWRTVWNFLKRPVIKLSHDPEFPLLWIYSEETRIEKYTCTFYTTLVLFITALFIIAQTWKQPRCPLADEWIKKLWYLYTMEYYSAIKWNTFESVLMRWMNLDPTIQSEVRKRKISHIYAYIQNLERWYCGSYTQDSKEDTDTKKQTLDSGEEEEGGMI